MDDSNSFVDAPESYAAARPHYPEALFEWIAATCHSRGAAWDCATGSGQAAIGLAPYFQTVYATDISCEQVEQGFGRPNIIYSAQPAEETNFSPGMFDLVTVAQALHWFDLRRFWAEVARVAKPGALFCAWGYSWFESDPAVDAELVQPFVELVAPYWAANNRILWNGYRDGDIAFPFERVSAPDFSMEADWTIPQLADYLKTWSAYKRARKDPPVALQLDALLDRALSRLRSDTPFRFSTRLALVAGRVPKR